ncbi:hypothetical protein C0995_007315 [Termitomyces sp. Mi166|nr:hypothetical protein C0995_007315 [Termitomyces sp. Mi166\
MAWYCSKGCQKRDWATHRNVCGENRPSRDPLAHPRIRAFFLHLLEEQMMSRQKAINDRFNSFRLTSPTPQPLILLFDYNKQIPPKISIHAPEALERQTNKGTSACFDTEKPICAGKRVIEDAHMMRPGFGVVFEELEKGF